MRSLQVLEIQLHFSYNFSLLHKHGHGPQLNTIYIYIFPKPHVLTFNFFGAWGIENRTPCATEMGNY
jgi:hypothetical protein